MAWKAYSFAMAKKWTHSLAQKLANEILVASPELLQFVENGYYVPIPIDTDHFKVSKMLINEQKEALTINTEVSSIQRTIDYCRKHEINLDIEVYDRTKYPIMYADMPSFLKRYKVYVDIRFVNEILLQHLSSTALQSLACGVKVIDYRRKFLQFLPSEHEPMSVVSRLLSIYSK
jgi:hypothetical protein